MRQGRTIKWNRPENAQHDRAMPVAAVTEYDAVGGANGNAMLPTGRGRSRSGGDGSGGSGRFSPTNKTVLGLFFAFLVVLVVGSLVRLPYVIESPGPTVNTLGEQSDGGKSTPLIAVAGLPSYPTQGALKFTTVRLAGGPGFPVDLWDVMGAWFDSSSVIRPVDEVFDPTASKEQIAQQSNLQMKGSQQEATAVALRAIGKKVPTYLVVAGFADASKAKGVLKVGDRVVKAGAEQVTSPASLRQALGKVTPGQPIALTVKRSSTSVPVRVTTVTSRQGGAALGIFLGIDHDFPAKITISAGDVGGPSAGLMFSLGIYDKLTPGALTGNHQIAGTGTIDDNAAVGPIGGIAQKMAGARDGGANFFLAPAANCADVLGNVPDGLQVFKVGTFDQARTAVEGIASGQTASLARCS